MVDKKILTLNEYNIFFNNLNTINRQMHEDLNNLVNKKISKKYFVKKYGHLRPSTYSISSANYKTNFNQYFSKPKLLNKTKRSKFIIKNFKSNNINKLFKLKNLSINSTDFFSFAKKSIELREWGKFIFTKSLDEIFNNLELLSKEINIPKDDLNYISINTILNYNSNLDQKQIKFLIKEEITKNKNSMKILEQIKLPDLLTKVDEIDFFYLNKVKGNYITDKSTYGKIKYIKNVKSLNAIKNSIVLIENADPGYDFIFSHNIKGFISKYGGANSHMAIRCMELGIPAIIGVGEKNFKYIRSNNNLFIDCKQQIFKILN